MLRKTLNGEDVPEEEDFWAESSLAETIGSKDWELKKRTFHMKHNEEINYIPLQRMHSGYFIERFVANL